MNKPLISVVDPEDLGILEHKGRREIEKII